MYLLLLLEHGLLDFSLSDRLDRLLLFSTHVTQIEMYLSVLILGLFLILDLEGSLYLSEIVTFHIALID